MTWILTALSGALLGGSFCLLMLLLLRVPNKPLVIGRFRWSGLFYYWFQHKWKGLISAQLLSVDPQRQLRNFLTSDATREKAESWIGQQVDGYIKNTLPEKWPMVSMLIGEKTQEKVRTAIEEQLRSQWQPAMESICSEHLTNDQIMVKVFEYTRSDQPLYWAKRAWQQLIRKAGILLILFVLSGALLALTGRLLFNLLINL